MELALVLPLLALLLLLVVQVVAVARDQVLVVHAAREAARQAAVDPDEARIRLVASETGLDRSGLQVDVRGRGRAGSRVTVTVHYRSPMHIPLVGRFVGDVSLVASAVMRVENDL